MVRVFRTGVIAACVLAGLSLPGVAAAADPVPLEPVSCAGRTDVVRVKSSSGDGRPVCFEIPDDFGEYAVDVPGAYLLSGDAAHPITVTLIDDAGKAGAVDIDLGGWTSVGAGKEGTAASALRLISAATAKGYAAVTAERQRLATDEAAEFFLGSPYGHVQRANPAAAEAPERLGWIQQYEAGAIYYTATGGAHAIYGPLYARYLKTGGPAGPLGYPATSQALGGEIMHADFTGNPAGGGAIYWTPEAGPGDDARALYGPVWEKWVALGREAWFSHPLTGLAPTPNPQGPNGAGSYVHFGQPTDAGFKDPNGPANASVYYSEQTGQAHAVQGSIRQTWRQNGWEQGRFGFPTTDEQTTSTGWTQRFQHGAITWNRGASAPILTFF
ncbi:LGFP repeat-containing protein [Amycolatopsis sp. NPDC054798]